MVLLLFLATPDNPSRAQSTVPVPDTLSRYADTLYAHAKFDDALAAYIRIERATRTPEQRSINWKWKNRIADIFVRQSLMRSADSVLSLIPLDAPTTSRADSLQLALTLSLLGGIRGYNNEYATAIEYARRCLHLRISCAPVDSSLVMEAHHSLGALYLRMGRCHDALAAIAQAETLARATAHESPYSLVTVLTSRGYALESCGDHAAAITTFGEALALTAHAPPEILELSGRCHHYLGAIYRDQGELRRAEQHFRMSLQIHEKLYGRRNLMVSTALARLGEVSLLLGDVRAAVRYYEEALPITASILGTDHSSYAWQEYQFSLALMADGQASRALALGTKAAGDFGRAFGAFHPLTAQVLEGVAELQEQGGTMTEAVAFMRRALAIRDSIAEGNEAPQRARCLAKLGRILLAQGATAEAASAYARSRALQDTMQQRVPLVYARTIKGIGDVERRLGHTARALDSYQEALRVVSPGFMASTWLENPALPGIDLAEFYRDVLSVKATALASEAPHTARPVPLLQGALTCWTLAADAATMLRRFYREEESKLRLQRDVFPVYESGMGVSVQLYARTHRQEYLESAFQFAERGKAAVLLEERLRTRTRRLSDTAAVSRQDSLADLVRGLSTRLERLLQEGRIQEGETARRQLFNTTEALRAIDDSANEASPAGSDLGRPASLAELCRHLAPHEAVVEYTIGPSRLFIVVARRAGSTLHSVPLPADFEARVRRFVGSIKTLDRKGFVDGGTSLYRLLLAPVERQIAGSRHLMIIPDGVLSILPFETLLREHAGSGTYASLPYLLRSHAVSYLFSAGMLLANRITPAPAENHWSFAGFAPVFRDSTESKIPAGSSFASSLSTDDLRSVTVDGQRYRELPYSEHEVRAIGEEFSRHGAPSTAFCNGSATLQNLKTKGQRATFVHIATHGVVNPDRPDLSALVLAPGDTSMDGDNGILYAGDTYALHMNARLVTLSSCESGVGKFARGEGVLGIARGFYAAGARSLLPSLWKVGDQRTSTLMLRFYRAVWRGQSFAEALRQAKLAALNTPATATPFAWGGFILLGE